MLPFNYAEAARLSLEGAHVVPHRQSSEMRYSQKTDFSLGARVEVFLRNDDQETIVIPSTAPVRVRGGTPAELLQSGEWAWHDLPPAWGGDPLRLPPGTLTVWSWNGKRAAWGTNTRAELAVTLSSTGEPRRFQVQIDEPSVWLSAVTFLGAATNAQPDTLIFHLVNQTPEPLQLEACRLWLPANNATWRALLAQPWISNDLERFPADGLIPSGNRGGARFRTGKLPLTYAALEVKLTTTNGKPLTVWAHQRIKRESFDISGGWVSSPGIDPSKPALTEAFLKTLGRMHVNTGHIQDLPGYTDQTGPGGLYTKYPLKYVGKFEPLAHYDSDALLPRIHAVEFLGEPQYGGGRPVPPQEVWKQLSFYAPTRLPTSVTHSEERVWRFYAGLSDYPHYDAYRVTAPSADAWGQYDRWGGERIRWGAPLETIGEMTRSLRELNRPRPIAYWCQGAHHDWDSYGGRKRRSPTPDELHHQAYGALASRVTSLYWFNLSVRSLLNFPDLIEPITRVGREVRMLDSYYLEGDAVNHERVLSSSGKPEWDLSVVAGPRGAVLFALDLDYHPDPALKVFKFGPPREASFRFRLPAYLSRVAEVFRVDADGTSSVNHHIRDEVLFISDRASRTAVYVAAAKSGERERIDALHAALIAREDSYGFDPGRNASDLGVLKQLVGGTRK